MRTLKKWKVVLILLLVDLLCCGLAAAEYRIQVSEDQLSPVEGLDKQWLNVLLVGTDNRTKVQGSGRSDTMMICSYNRESGELKLTSLARDIWVQIPGAGKNRLNAAHSFGGPNLLMKTINETFQLNVTKYISVNFYGFIDIVDLIGGVDIELEPGEAGVINRKISGEFSGEAESRLPSDTVGLTHLNGVQALQYARIRQLDNDFGRTARQRKLIDAMLTQVKQLSLMKQISLVKNCMQYVSTNMSLTEMSGIGLDVMGKGVSGFEQLSIPQKGAYHYESADGISKVIFDQEACVEALHAFIYE